MGTCEGRGHQSDPSYEANLIASMAMNLECLGLVGSREGRNSGQGSPYPKSLPSVEVSWVSKAIGGWGRKRPYFEVRNGGVLRRIHLFGKAGK